MEECRWIWVSDIHFPLHLERETDIFTKVVTSAKPDLLILGGDIFDFYGLSKFGIDPRRNQDFIQEEFDIGRGYIEEWVKHSKRAVMIEGNHEARLRKRLVESTPALYGLRSLALKKVAELPVKLEIYPFQVKLKQGPLYMFHGTSTVQYVASKYLREHHVTAIAGHSHRPDFAFHNYLGEQKMVAISGCLQDMKKAWYVDHPSWIPGFLSGVIYTTKNKSQAVYIEQNIFNNNSVVFSGKVWK
jgi:predicted phosphodiesterase